MSIDKVNSWNRKLEVDYTDISKTYNIAMDWLASNGIVKKNSRLEKYQKVLEDISNKNLNINDIKTKYDTETLIGALYDGIEFVDIYTSLINLSESIPENYLKNLVGGPLAYYNETSNNSLSRNLIFELYVASKLKTSGFNIRIDCLSDIEIDYDNHRIFVECKRLSSYNQFAKRLKEGYHQLNKSYSKYFNHNTYGMLFISLSKIISPAILNVTDNSIDKIKDSVGKYFISILDDQFENLRKASKKTLCVWLHVRIPFLSENKDFGIYSRHLSFDLIDNNSKGWSILNSMHKQMNLNSLDALDCLNILYS